MTKELDGLSKVVELMKRDFDEIARRKREWARQRKLHLFVGAGTHVKGYYCIFCGRKFSAVQKDTKKISVMFDGFKLSAYPNCEGDVE